MKQLLNEVLEEIKPNAKETKNYSVALPKVDAACKSLSVVLVQISNWSIPHPVSFAHCGTAQLEHGPSASEPYATHYAGPRPRRISARHHRRR